MATDPTKPSEKSAQPKSEKPKGAKNAPSPESGADGGQEDLPEREPLTPEIVEDEAIRGDFMMRWALVLLALMFGVTEILETETLVHIKSGQYTLQNGLPARTGIFSSTAEERPWSNLSWLFDVVLAGFFQLGETVGVGGAVMLSVFKGLLAAVVFGFLVHTGRKDVSTWWGTVCAAIALLVCYRQFTARPEIITLLGVTLTLSFLNRWREEDKNRHLKCLVVLFLVWSNLDPGMFYGLAVLLFYAAGESAGQWLGFSGLPDEAMRKRLWMTVGACFAVTLLNPSGWNSLWEPYLRYSVEYPAWREFFPSAINFSQLQYYGLDEPRFWEQIDSVSVAGLILMATALVTFFLNFRRLDLGDVLLWLGCGAFALAATHELALAAVVSAVLATTNAQDWYRATFRQTYSVETSELVFSRGGRAVTVLALFGLAYLSVSGRLDRRTGVGFDPHLQGAIDGLREELDDSFDDRPFHFIPSQGDLLIWIDQKAYIDSRLALYRGEGDEDLIGLHRRTRAALRKINQAGPAGQLWKEGLDRFEITHVLPRLDSRRSLSGPDFITFARLAHSKDWRMTRVGPTTAVFYRTDLRQPQLTAYLNTHKLDFTELVFRKKFDIPEVRASWAVGRSTYEDLLSRRREFKPNAVELAEHYEGMISVVLSDQRSGFLAGVGSDAPSFILAMRHFAIRKANEGLAESPNCVSAFRLLGQCYMRLEDVELQLSGQNRFSSLGRRRDRQALAALSQALILDPTDLRSQESLALLHQLHGRVELAAEALEKCLAIYDEQPKRGRENDDIRIQYVRARDQAKSQVKQALEQLESQGVDELPIDPSTRNKRGQLVGLAINIGLTQRAITLIEADEEWMAGNREVLVIYLSLLQHAGRFEDAAEQLQNLNVGQDELRQHASLHDVSAYNALARADFPGAAKTWGNLAKVYDDMRLRAIFEFIPFTVRSPETLAYIQIRRDRSNRPVKGLWATDQLASLQATDRQAGEVAAILMNVGLTELEAGRMENAAAQFRRIVDIAPTAPITRLAAFYVKLITGDDVLPKQPVPAEKKPADKKP